jgi:hypothetical protein
MIPTTAVAQAPVSPEQMRADLAEGSIMVQYLQIVLQQTQENPAVSCDAWYNGEVKNGHREYPVRVITAQGIRAITPGDNGSHLTNMAKAIGLGEQILKICKQYAATTPTFKILPRPTLGK